LGKHLVTHGETKMLQFTIREMAGLTVIVALAIGWLIHSHSEQTENQYTQIFLMDQRLDEMKALVEQLQAVKETVAAPGENELASGTPQSASSVPPPAAGAPHVRVMFRRRVSMSDL
jgi:hypothetical protein